MFVSYIVFDVCQKLKDSSTKYFNHL